MNQDESPRPSGRPGSAKRQSERSDLPEWTNGLKRLYDEVVDEDLPDSFRDLLSRLDDGK